MYWTCTWDLVRALESAFFPYCRIPATFIDSICQNNQEKVKNSEMRPNSQKLLLFCLGLHAQNSGLREVDLDPSLRRGSDMSGLSELLFFQVKFRGKGFFFWKIKENVCKVWVRTLKKSCLILRRGIIFLALGSYDLGNYCMKVFQRLFLQNFINSMLIQVTIMLFKC